MKYTKLGNSDLNVSRICMGCMGFGDAGRGQHLADNAGSGNWLEGMRFDGGASKDEIQTWIDGLQK